MDPISSTTLNLSYCDTNKATVSIPAVIDKEKEDIFDPGSGYYNDDCYTYTTENGTDITKKDRQDEYVNNNLSLCDNNCKYERYDDINQRSICTCNIQNKPESTSEFMNGKVQKPEEFTSDEESSSITTRTIKCLSLNGLKTTISIYILIIITLYFLFSTVSFIKCGFRKIKDNINKIITTKEKEMIRKANKQITRGNNYIYNNKNNPPIKGQIRFMTNEYQGKRYHRALRSDLNKFNSFNKLKLFNDIIHKEEGKIKYSKNKRNFQNGNTSIKNFKNNFIKYNFSDYELNIMTYQEAVIYDKRSCCKYYTFLLKIKHPILFAFCPIKDYITFIIKYCLFFLSFACYFITNFIFFNEDVIHKIYEDGGKYNIIYFSPKISISFAISYLITIMTKYIFLSESNILEIKRQKSLIVAHSNTFKVINKLRTKYIFFFLLGIIFLIICWALIASFGVVYKNTELNTFKKYFN